MHRPEGIARVSIDLTPLPRLQLHSPSPIVPHGQSRVYPLVLQIRQEGVLKLLVLGRRDTAGVHDQEPESLDIVSRYFFLGQLQEVTYAGHEFGISQHDSSGTSAQFDNGTKWIRIVPCFSPLRI
jgi:hypothetical protein